MDYGEKMNYPKIDIYVNGKYECSTTWAKSCKEARAKFVDQEYKALFMAKAQSMTAHFAK